jgi:hypothetical protein
MNFLVPLQMGGTMIAHAAARELACKRFVTGVGTLVQAEITGSGESASTIFKVAEEFSRAIRVRNMFLRLKRYILGFRMNEFVIA